MRAAAIGVALVGFPAWSAGWNIELYGGAPVNVSTSLVIHQSGQPDLRTTAQYESRPFETPWYYDLRIGRWSGKDVVQIGARPDGTPIRWTFTEITTDSFRWTGEALEPDMFPQISRLDAAVIPYLDRRDIGADRADIIVDRFG